MPELTSLHATMSRGNYGRADYPGNCSGYLIKDLLRYFKAMAGNPRDWSVFDPMEGSGTCRDVCKELRIPCLSTDLRKGFDATDAEHYLAYAGRKFDFVWAHPPYYRQKVYSDDPRDLSAAPTLEAFLEGYGRFIRNCVSVLAPGGHFAILMGDYHDRVYRFVPLVQYTKELCFRAGLRQTCTDIIRFSHGAGSSSRSYRSSFIPGLHDVVTITAMDGEAYDSLDEAGGVPYLNGGAQEE